MCQAEAFKRPDDITGEIELPPVEPVEGGTWEGVMIVEPAKMGMKEAFRRAMGVTLAVGLRMVLDVCRSKLDGRSFYPHATQDEQNKLHGGMRSKAAMGQHAMKAGSHT